CRRPDGADARSAGMCVATRAAAQEPFAGCRQRGIAGHGHPQPRPVAADAAGWLAPTLRCGVAAGAGSLDRRCTGRAGQLSPAGLFRPARRAVARGGESRGAGLPGAPHDGGSRGVAGRPRWRRATLHVAAGTSRGTCRRADRPAGAGARCRHAVRGGARAAGTDAAGQTGARLATDRARLARLRAGRARPVRPAPRQRAADRATARTPARAAGRSRGVSAGQHQRSAPRARTDHRQPRRRQVRAAPASHLVAGATHAGARYGATHPGRPGATGNRLVGWRRGVPRLLHGGNRAGPARMGILRAGRAGRLDAARVVCMSAYAELHCLSNFSFGRGASSARELFERAQACGYSALAITDECSLAGIVRALEASRATGVKLIVGAEFQLDEGPKLVLLCETKAGYTALCELITRGRRASVKGTYRLGCADLADGVPGTFALWLPARAPDLAHGRWMRATFGARAWLAVELHHDPDDAQRLRELTTLAQQLDLRLVAAGDVHMHVR